MVGDLRDERGVVFEAEIDLVESLGSDLYAYFHVESGAVESDQLADLVEERLEETGVPEVREGQEQIVARLDPASKIKRRDTGRALGRHLEAPPLRRGERRAARLRVGHLA